MEVGTAKESHPVRAVNRACGPFLLLLVASCAGGPGGAPEPGARADDLLLLNRVTWGANPSSARALARMGPASYLEVQLQPAQEAALPPEVQAQVDAMTITQRPVDELAKEMESRRKGLDLLRNDEEKKAAQQAYQQELTRLGREARDAMTMATSCSSGALAAGAARPKWTRRSICSRGTLPRRASSAGSSRSSLSPTTRPKCWWSSSLRPSARATATSPRCCASFSLPPSSGPLSGRSSRIPCTTSCRPCASRTTTRPS